jgi:NTP pyrophosphatase (non-canonical NTP hydrolase)
VHDHQWDQVQQLRGWLDDNMADALSGDVQLLRILKISEELGEVAEALHGVTGANPRKGASHSWEDVRAELGDVILTAMVALATVSDTPEKDLAHRLDHVVRRVLPQAQQQQQG